MTSNFVRQDSIKFSFFPGLPGRRLGAAAMLAVPFKRIYTIFMVLERCSNFDHT